MMSERSNELPLFEISCSEKLMDGSWKFDEYGLSVDVNKNEYIEYVPHGVIVGDMDFIPFGDLTFTPDLLSDKLLYGIGGLTSFFEEVKKHTVKPEYLYGETNSRMARLAERLGFSIVEFDGEYHHILAKPEQVKASLEQLLTRRDRNNRLLVDKLMLRSKQ